MTAETPAARGGAGRPDAQEALLQDIERTRERLGASLEALVAKTDVKARARKNTDDMAALLRARVEQARCQAGERVARVRSQFAGTIAGVRHAVPSPGSPGRHRAQGGTAAAPATPGAPGAHAGAGRSWRAARDLHARQAAAWAVSVAREHPVLTAVTVATVTVALEYLIPALRRR